MSYSDWIDGVGFIVNFFNGEAGNGLYFSLGDKLSSASLESATGLSPNK